MAKSSRNHARRGKVAPYVNVPKGKYKEHTRNLPSYTAKSSIAAINGQFSRTQVLNKLGSEINRIIGGYSRKLKSEDFYRRMQSCFRKVSGVNRYVLLTQLKDIEINERYTSKDFAGCNYEIKATKDDVLFELNTTHHYLKAPEGSNCYYFTLILIAWPSEEYADVIHFRKKSRWINIKDECPRFIFSFPLNKPISQWMLCLGQQIGRNNIEDEMLASQGMKILQIGTFLEEDLEALENCKPARIPMPKDPGFPEFDDDERVQAIGDDMKPHDD